LTRLVLTIYRLGILAAAFLCLYSVTKRRDQGRAEHFDAARALGLVQSYLPKAASIGSAEGDDRVSPVLDAKGEPVGWAAQTNPEAPRIIGYAGPSNLLIVFDASRTVAGVVLMESADTSGHVSKVVDDPGFFSQWNGRNQAGLGRPGAHCSSAAHRSPARRFHGASPPASPRRA